MIKEKLQADQLTALKSGDKKTLETLRYILAQIKNKEIEKRADLEDEEVVSILRKQAKQLQESIDAFTKGGRADLVTQYEEQQKIVAQYVPPELTDEQLSEEIKRIKSTYTATDPKALIGICMRELKNKAEPGRIMKTLTALG